MYSSRQGNGNLQGAYVSSQPTGGYTSSQNPGGYGSSGMQQPSGYSANGGYNPNGYSSTQTHANLFSPPRTQIRTQVVYDPTPICCNLL
jgi:hypothetical protein